MYDFMLKYINVDNNDIIYSMVHSENVRLVNRYASQMHQQVMKIYKVLSNEEKYLYRNNIIMQSIEDIY